MSKYKLQSISTNVGSIKNLFGNVLLIKHMKMARFSFAIPLVRVIYFVLTGVLLSCVSLLFLSCVLLMCCYGVV